MAAVYWFAMIVGGGVLAASFVGDLLGAQLDEPSGGGDTDAAKLLSLRNLTYFLFAFGATGLGLQWLTRLPGIASLALAGVVGVLSASAAALLFDYVRRTDTGSRETDDSFVGCTGRVTLPFAPDHAGRVLVRRGEREHELRARPYDERSAGVAIGVGIVVVEMDGGTALVAPLEEALPAPGRHPRIESQEKST